MSQEKAPRKYSEQELFWSGDFGDQYIHRNRSPELEAGNTHLFSKIISCTRNVKSVLEFGANVGLNIQALKRLLPEATFHAVEVNAQATEELKLIKGLHIYHQSLFDFVSKSQIDFVLVKGVLIHLNPDLLSTAYEIFHRTSRRYICFVEYYNPTPISIPYRGHSNKLFKRDFAGEFLDTFSDFHLLNYGFCYHRDPVFPMDDLTWFIMEKK